MRQLGNDNERNTVKTFKTKFNQHDVHNGKTLEVLRELGDDERDPEVGRMFAVKLSTGEEIQAFEDEIVEEDPTITLTETERAALSRLIDCGWDGLFAGDYPTLGKLGDRIRKVEA